MDEETRQSWFDKLRMIRSDKEGRDMMGMKDDMMDDIKEDMKDDGE